MAFQNGIVPIMRGYGVFTVDDIPYESAATLIGTGSVTAYGNGNNEPFANMIGVGTVDFFGEMTDPRSARLIGIGALVAIGRQEINVDPIFLGGIGIFDAMAGIELTAYTVIRGTGLVIADVEYYKDPAPFEWCYDLHINRITEQTYCNVNKCFPVAEIPPIPPGSSCEDASCGNHLSTVTVIRNQYSWNDIDKGWTDYQSFGDKIALTCNSLFIVSYLHSPNHMGQPGEQMNWCADYGNIKYAALGEVRLDDPNNGVFANICPELSSTSWRGLQFMDIDSSNDIACVTYTYGDDTD